jgi:hypothetical protein
LRRQVDLLRADLSAPYFDFFIAVLFDVDKVLETPDILGLGLESQKL